MQTAGKQALLGLLLSGLPPLHQHTSNLSTRLPPSTAHTATERSGHDSDSQRHTDIGILFYHIGNYNNNNLQPSRRHQYYIP
jgi:hypothetical protein